MLKVEKVWGFHIEAYFSYRAAQHIITALVQPVGGGGKLRRSHAYSAVGGGG